MSPGLQADPLIPGDRVDDGSQTGMFLLLVLLPRAGFTGRALPALIPLAAELSALQAANPGSLEPVPCQPGLLPCQRWHFTPLSFLPQLRGAQGQAGGLGSPAETQQPELCAG